MDGGNGRGKDRTCLLENNKAATCIHWDGDGARAVLIITWKDAGIMEQIEAMFLAVEIPLILFGNQKKNQMNR